MTRWKNSPQKKGQEDITGSNLLKKDISDISEQQFRKIVIKLLAGLGKSIEDNREPNPCCRNQNTPLAAMGRSSKQKVNKKTMALND